MRKTIFAAVVLALGCWVGAADDALSPEQIRAGEAKQTQIKVQTQQVAAQLQSIIEEFKRNGLDGQDVEVLEAIRRVLGKLSDQEMKKVIDALQEARAESDPGTSKKVFAGAVSDQKAIIAQLRALLLEYQRQQALYELSLRLAALAERQNGNLKTVVDLAKLTGNQTASRFDDTQRASLQIQAADQQGLKDEVNPLLTKIETLSKDADGPTKDRLKAALYQVQIGGLKPAMDSSIEDLKSAALYRAAGSEKIIRDQLKELARQVAPPKDTLAALQAALKEIEKNIEAEKTIIDQTKKLEKRTETAELETRQADVVDKTDAVRTDLQAIAPDASNELKTAQNQMQEARASLSDHKQPDAVKNESAALDKLEAAKKALQEQIAKTEPQQKPEDKLAAAKQLQERAKELIKKEEEIKTATAANEKKDKELKAIAPKQANVEEQTKDLQRDAAAQNPEASQSVAEAANQMDKSEKNLSKPQPQTPKAAQEAQAAAISALKQADEQLGKQVQQLEKAKQDLADLQDSRAKVLKLIEGQQKVQLSTAKLAAKAPANTTDDKPKPGKAEVNYYFADEAGQKAASSPKELSPPQGELANQTDKVKTELLDTEKDASQPLDDAKKNMLDAKGKLDANDAKRANPAQLEALVNLYKAKEALDKKIADLQKQLGHDPQNADPNAAADKIAQLQQDVAKANDQLNQDAQQMQKSLQQQQQEIAKQLQQMQKDQQPNAQQKAPLDKAQQAAQQAAEQLAQNQNADAMKSMQKAEQGIREAMKAQPQQGEPQQGQPEQGQPEKGQPQQGQPEQGQPQQGEPQQGQPQQGQPQQGQPQKGQPQQGQPQQGQPQQGQPQQGLPALAQKQSDLQKQLEQMMTGSPTQQAAGNLEQAANEAGEMAQGQQGNLPPGAQQAMQEAAAALSQAAAAASAGDTQSAQSSASEAQAALSQAAAALSLAQAGLNGKMASAQGKPGEGQGQEPGQGEGQQPGQGQGKGKQGQGKGQGNGPNNPNKGTGDRKSIQGGSFAGAAANNEQRNNGAYQALPQRDRNAITQSRSEKYPEEYGPQVEQYLKNLADQDQSK